jgi:hypothetical protein
MTKKRRPIFTKHAEEAMVKRELSEELVISAVRVPDKVFLDRRSGFMVAIKEKEVPLVVVYDVVDDEVEVITAFKTSKLDKIIKSRLEKGCFSLHNHL